MVNRSKCLVIYTESSSKGNVINILDFCVNSFIMFCILFLIIGL